MHKHECHVCVSACVYACLIVCKYTYTCINVFVICVSDIHVCVEGYKQEVLHQLYFDPPWIIGRKLTTGSGSQRQEGPTSSSQEMAGGKRMEWAKRH